MTDPLLDRAAAYAKEYLAAVAERPAGAATSAAEMRAALGGPLPDRGEDPAATLEALIEHGDRGVTASQGPRFFGFVIGGSYPVATAADWLAAAWDQCAAFQVLSPAASAIEEICREWMADLLGLPAHTSMGMTTGCQMAHVTCLSVAVHHLLARRGWDVGERGLNGVPAIRVVAPEDRHATVDRTLRLLGLGTGCLRLVPCDGQARMDVDALRRELAADADAPTIVVAQAGNVATGGFDPIGAAADAAHEHGAWAHVDGAFGGYAAASPRLRHLTEGMERADSWAIDGHKTLNVPYDCGFALCAHPQSHAAAMRMAASYLVASPDDRDPADWSAESSRRARTLAVYAVLRSLGRAGVADLVERLCDRALRFAELLGAAEDAEILNDVVFNQVLVRFGDDDALTDAVIEGVQREGTCWLGGTTWRGRRALRIAVSHWATSEEDVERSVDAILRVRRALVPELRH